METMTPEAVAVLLSTRPVYVTDEPLHNRSAPQQGPWKQHSSTDTYGCVDGIGKAAHALLKLRFLSLYLRLK